MYLKIHSRKLKFNERNLLLNDKNPFKEIRNILREYYFVYGQSEIPSQIESFIREKAKEQGGHNKDGNIPDLPKAHEPIAVGSTWDISPGAESSSEVSMV